MVLNGGTIKDSLGNNAVLTFTPPSTSGIKINYPSLGMDFVADRYTVNGTAYNSLSSFLSATGGSFTRASTATYFDSSGTLQTAAADEPRFDYDPSTHEAKGILIEESRKNVFPNSTLNNWTGQSYTTYAYNAVAAPDGSNTGVAIGTSGGPDPFVVFMSSNIGSIASRTFTFSVWVKLDAAAPPVGGYYLYLINSSDPNEFAVHTFTPTNNWQRFSITKTFASTAAAVKVHGRVDLPLNVTGTFVDVWGPQLEEGPFPTSYIATAGSPAIREADILTMPTGGWLNAAKGALYGQGSLPYMGGSGFPSLASMNDGTADNAVGFYIDDAFTDKHVAQVYSSAAQQMQTVSAAAVTADTTVREALAYANNDANAAFNGVLTTADTSVIVPTLSQLRVGLSRGTNYLNGWVQKVRYYPERVTDTQIQLLTQ